MRTGTVRYVEGGSLANASRSFGKFSEHLVACYAAKMLEGLHYLHGQDVGRHTENPGETFDPVADDLCS
jgi:serine/threonine protein kinase